MPKGLTIKQEKFCNKYIELGNASEAYRQSYDSSKCTNKSINELAAQLLADIKISSRITELKQELSKRNEVTIDEIVEALRLAKTLSEQKEDLTNLRGSAMDLAKVANLLVDRADVKLTAVDKYSLEMLERAGIDTGCKGKE